jgi:RNA polymerase sigma-70 factor (ECF subfamily)
MDAFTPSMSPSRSLPNGCTLSLVDQGQYVGAGQRVRPSTPGWEFQHGIYRPPVNAFSSNVHEDQQIVTAMARGDELAAARLYDRYSAAMFALAFRITGEAADAEDVVLEVFTQVWDGASTYDGSRGSVIAWITTITRTRSLDCVRSRSRRVRAVDTASRQLGDDPLAVAPAAANPSDVAELGERALAVSNAMAVLSGQQRSAIELAFFEGLSHTEIADRLGEPLGTIKTRIRLGMQKLRDVLRDVSPEATS